MLERRHVPCLFICFLVYTGGYSSTLVQLPVNSLRKTVLTQSYFSSHDGANFTLNLTYYTHIFERAHAYLDVGV